MSVSYKLTNGSNIIVMFDKPNFSDLVVSARSCSYSLKSLYTLTCPSCIYSVRFLLFRTIFGTLVRIRTKSGIPDLIGPTV